MKKSQVTLYVIIGLVLVIMLSFFLFRNSSSDSDEIKEQTESYSSFALEKKSFQSYFEQCSKNALIKSNLEFGIEENTKKDYIIFLNKNVETCMNSYLISLKNKGFIVSENLVKTEIEYNENTLITSIFYPIIIEKGENKFFLDEYTETFPKIETLSLNNGEVLKDTILNSPDRKARLLLKKGTFVTDENGNNLNSISIKIQDVHFDNLENDIVVGNLVYEGLPDGAHFSKPIELSVEFRAKDYPISENEKSLSIAWWDKSTSIWRGLSTNVENGMATAEINHFTKFSVVVNCNPDESDNFFRTPYLFKQKYFLKHSEIDKFVSEENIIKEIEKNKIEDLDFCENTDNKYWMVEGEEAIIPTIKEYLKILNEEEERIDLSINTPEWAEMQEDNTIIYGISGSCEDEVEVPLYCCCNSEGDCEKEPLSLQECLFLYREENVDLLYIPLDGICLLDREDYNLIETEKLTAKKKIFGYNNINCIGGSISGNPIMEIIFEDKGNSCLAGDTPIELKTLYNEYLDKNSNCNVVWEFIVESDVPKIIVKSTSVSSEENKYCANCRAYFEIHGTGINGERACQSEGESLMVNNECLKCTKNKELSTEENPVYTANELGGDCTCNRQTLGLAYCNGVAEDGTKGKIICTDEFGEFGFYSWSDPDNICGDCVDPSKQNDPKCDIIFYVDNSEGGRQ